MDELLAIALVGTAKKGSLPTEHVSPVAELVTQLRDLSPERQLLLAAGATSVFEFAGAPASLAKQDRAPAPQETLRAVSPRAASILAELIHRPGSEPDVLLEACQLLREHGQVLAPELLPDALAVTDGALRAALQAVLGERGRWLSQFDKSWQWATAPPASEAEFTEEELEPLWNEGLPTVRRMALDRARRTNPERARQWLAEAWPREKAEVRQQLLETVSATIADDDIPFLESVAGDRSAPVRALASMLLCRLEGSSLAGRVRGWCDSFVTRAEAERSLTAKLRELAGGNAGLRLAIKPPAGFNPAWRELGIAEKPPAKVGKRAYWLVELVRRVNPHHWQQRFQASPRDLILAAELDDFGQDLIEAWSDAARLFAAADWTDALWNYWLEYEPAEKSDRKVQRRNDLLPVLLASMPAERAEHLLSECMARSTNLPWQALVEALPKPWRSQFGAAYLRRVRASLANVKAREDRVAWAETLPAASVALRPDCFAAALGNWTLPESDDYYHRLASNQVAKFLTTVQTRARLRESITKN